MCRVVLLGPAVESQQAVTQQIISCWARMRGALERGAARGRAREGKHRSERKIGRKDTLLSQNSDNRTDLTVAWTFQGDYTKARDSGKQKYIMSLKG